MCLLLLQPRCENTCFEREFETENSRCRSESDRRVNGVRSFYYALFSTIPNISNDVCARESFVTSFHLFLWRGFIFSMLNAALIASRRWSFRILFAHNVYVDLFTCTRIIASHLSRSWRFKTLSNVKNASIFFSLSENLCKSICSHLDWSVRAVTAAQCLKWMQFFNVWHLRWSGASKHRIGDTAKSILIAWIRYFGRQISFKRLHRNDSQSFFLFLTLGSIEWETEMSSHHETERCRYLSHPYVLTIFVIFNFFSVVFFGIL